MGHHGSSHPAPAPGTRRLRNAPAAQPTVPRVPHTRGGRIKAPMQSAIDVPRFLTPPQGVSPPPEAERRAFQANSGAATGHSESKERTSDTPDVPKRASHPLRPHEAPNQSAIGVPRFLTQGVVSPHPTNTWNAMRSSVLKALASSG